MSNRILVPEAFIKQAKLLGINEKVATEVFYRFHYKKGLDDLSFRISANEREKFKANLPVLRSAYKVIVFGQAETMVVQEKKKLIQEVRKELDGLIGTFTPTRSKPQPKGVRKIALISDLHIPFHSIDAINTMLDTNPDEIYILGDYLDMYSSSRHPKNNVIPTKNELALGISIMDKLREHVSSITCIAGNHDNRALKALQATMPHILPLLLHPMELVASYFDNVNVVGLEVPNTAPEIPFGENHRFNTLFVQGNAAYSHLDTFSGATAAVDAFDWITKFNPVLGLSGVPQVLYQAHTHRLGVTYTPGGEQMVLLGCMCKTMSYVLDAPGKYPIPTKGFVTQYVDENNIVDLDTIKLHVVN